MANEVTYATLLSNGGRVAKILSAKVHENLLDTSSLRGLMEFRPFEGVASDTMNVTKLTRGAVAAAASSETSGGASNTALSTGNYDLTVARYLLKMQPSDLMGLTSGPIDVATVVSVLMQALDLTLTDLLVALFANISGNVGTSGADASVDDFFDAIYYLNLQNNPAALAAVLHNQQVNDLIESTRGETGAIQFRTDIQGFLKPPGMGWRGRLLEVDVYQSDSCPTANAGADRRGCMFSAGAFAYSLGPVARILGEQLVNPADILVATPEMFVERDRDAPNGLTSLFLNFYPATAEQEDLRAVRITTDA